MLEDYLVCGLCQRNFPFSSINNFMQHKLMDCEEGVDLWGGPFLTCQLCSARCNSALSLLRHIHKVHSIKIIKDQSDINSSSKDMQMSNVDVTASSLSPELAEIIDAEVSKTLSTDLSAIDTSLLTPDLGQDHPLVANNIAGSTSTETNQQQVACQYSNQSQVSGSSKMTSQHIGTSETHTVGKTSGKTGMASTGIMPYNNNIGKKIPHNSSIFTGEFDGGKSISTGKGFPSAFKTSGKGPYFGKVEGPYKGRIEQQQTGKNMSLCGKGKKQLPVKSIPSDDKENESDEQNVGVEMVDAAVQADVKKDDCMSQASGCSYCSCGLKECGVTVMPGTHEKLKECCNAVVPKKRKRHMETKHVPPPGVLTRRHKKFREGSFEKTRSTSPAAAKKIQPASGSILIDVDNRMEDTANNTANGKISDQTTTQKAEKTKKIDTSNQVEKEYISTKTKDCTENKGKEKSVIIQPGTTFSIPVRYASVNQSMPLLQLPMYVQSNVNNETQNLLVSKSSSSLMPIKGTGGISVKLVKSGIITAIRPVSNTSRQEKQINEDFTKSHTEMNYMNEDNKGEMRFQQKGKKRQYPTSKPYKCDQCDQAFNQRIHLRKHQSKHTGIKPYKCEECDYSTVERSHLKVHIRVHTGEKPFKCTYCEYATAQNSTLKIHLRRHHHYTEGRPDSSKFNSDIEMNIDQQMTNINLDQEIGSDPESLVIDQSKAISDQQSVLQPQTAVSDTPSAVSVQTNVSDAQTEKSDEINVTKTQIGLVDQKMSATSKQNVECQKKNDSDITL